MFTSYWGRQSPHTNAFCKLFTCCLHKQTYICFMFTSRGGIQRAPVSITDIRRHPACIISAGHSVTLPFWVIVLLYSVLWFTENTSLPDVFFIPAPFCFCLSMRASSHQLGFSDMLLQLTAKGPNNRNINHNIVRSSQSPAISLTFWSLKQNLFDTMVPWTICKLHKLILDVLQ